jgi:Holliday junction resolvasome RuvABC endonuclease subunit
VGRPRARFELIDSGHIATKPDADLNDRLRVIWQAFAKLCRDYRPSLVGVENQAGAAIGARMQGLKAAAKGEKAGGFSANNDPVFEVVGVIKAAAFAYNIPVMLYAPQQAKIAVLGRGSGNAKKHEVVAAIRSIFRGAIETDGRVLGEHEADAIAGAIYCERVTMLGARRRSA